MNIVQVYALNHAQPNPAVEGFTRFPRSLERCVEVQKQIKQDIHTGDWRHWHSEPKRYFVQRCMEKNWPICVTIGTTVE